MISVAQGFTGGEGELGEKVVSLAPGPLLGVCYGLNYASHRQILKS